MDKEILLNFDIKNLKVLVIEDGDVLRRFLRFVLENKFHFIVMEAKNGVEGLDILSRELPFLVILDLMMPEMNGVEVLNKIRENERTKDLPVIICTSVSDKRIVTGLIKKGITDYLLKPINVNQVSDKINEVLKIALEKNLKNR